MKNIACWDAIDAYAIVNPDADAQPDHVFRAIHTDFSVLIRSDRGSPATAVLPEELLRRFLAPRDHALVPVYGESGTGKSHLIRWMRMQLPENKTREVIFVPKAQTNLRDIVRALVDRLPESERQPYLEALRTAGGTVLSAEAQRTAILNQIHLALVNDNETQHTSVDPSAERYLLLGLRSVFTDAYLRQQHFLGNDRFAAEISAHVFEKPHQYQPAEQRRTFRESDLPLAIGDIARAAADTREFLQFLVAADHSVREQAVAIVNRHVDWAIAQCLNLSGDRLIELMLGIRRHLKQKGKALVLLIEDFARLQGLDRALLQSLMEQRPDLCLLRCAFASTIGFYDSIAETVKTRQTFVVDMDVPLGEIEHGVDVARFVGRYMNALRWGEKKLLADWKRSDGDSSNFGMPNKCDDCTYRETCHGTFGTADGFGLYPFTAKALDIMADRADPGARQKFNPRIFQKKVLRPVALLASVIEGGQFPPAELLRDLGDVRGFPPAARNRLQTADPKHWQRRLTLLQLWADAQDVQNLPDDIHAAFDLPPLKLEHATGAQTQAQAQPQAQPPTKDSGAAATGDDVRLEELSRWEMGQSKLTAKTAQQLRDLIFPALRDFIDWDDIGLAFADFASPTSAFRPGGIYFHNQATNPSAAVVSLTIPAHWEDKDERYRTVMALQGLIESQHHGGWAFKDGIEKLACLEECMRTWSQELVRQFRALDTGGADWDAAGAALEMRILAALMTTPNLAARSDLDLLRAGLSSFGSITQFATKGLTTVVDEIREREGDLLRVIKSRCTAMKGGSPGEYVDAVRLLPVVAALRKNGFVVAEGPADANFRVDALRKVAALSRRIASELPRLLREEFDERRAWHAEISGALGQNTKKSDVVAGLLLFLNEVGRFALQGTSDLHAAKSAYESSNFDEAMEAVNSLPPVGKERHQHLAIDVCNAITASRNLVGVFRSLLDRAEGEVRGRLQTAGIDVDVQKSLVAQLDTDLDRISKGLRGEADGDTA